MTFFRFLDRTPKLIKYQKHAWAYLVENSTILLKNEMEKTKSQNHGNYMVLF